MKNIFSRTTEKRTQNGLKTDSKRTNYGIPILILAFLTLGFGQVWGDEYTAVVGVAADNSSNYTVKLNVNRKGNGDDWEQKSMSKAGITFEGKKLYITSYTNKYGGLGKMQFQYHSGSTHKGQKEPISSWSTSTHDNGIYNYDGESWYSGLSFSTSARLYFDASTWDETSIKLCIGHANYQKYYSLTHVTNTKLYYGKSSDTWGDAMGIGVVGNTSASNGENWLTNVSSKAAEYTGFKHYALSSGDANNAYLMVPNGDAGEEPSMHYYSSHYTTGNLNKTQTIKYAVGINGATPAELTSGYVPADIAISSYKFSSGTYNSVFSSSGSVTLSQGGSNFSATVTAARTATTTYTVSNVHEDYSFLGWYDAPSGGSLLSSELSYTFYPTSATTAYARFSKENNHSVTISRYCTSTSTEINNTSAKIGEVTYSSIEAPEIYGYTFVNWTLGSGVTKHSSDALTSNPIRVITAASGDYTLTANYTEVLTTDWKLIGDNTTNSPFGDNYNYASGKEMTKKSGYSTEYKAYKTLDITKTGTWGFKVASSSASANIYGWGTGETYITFNRSNSGSKQDVYSGDQHQLKFNPDGLGEYEFKVDYTASPCSVTVTFPTVYTVTFSRGTVDGASGTVTAEYSSVAFSTGTKVQTDKSVTFKAPAAKTGYTFQGWYTVNNGSGTTNRESTEQNYTTTITAAKTLYACYTINNYAITHSESSHGTYTIKVGDASAVSTNTTSDYGKTITLAATPATGYHFGSWSAYKTETPATTVTVTDNKFTMPDYAVTVGATFTPNTYRVQFHRNGASETTVYQNFTYDVAQNLTANTYTRTGYTFAGWATSSSGEVVYTDGVEVSNLTTTNEGTFHLYAKWTPNPYTVVLDKQTSAEGYGGNAGTVTNQTVTFNATPATVSGTMPTAAQGYGFMGFYSATGGNGRRFIDPSGNWVTSAGDTISGGNWVKPAGITLYAYYKKAEITNLTFDAAVVAPSTEVGVMPTVAPTPAGTNSICWKLLYSNGNLYTPQPNFENPRDIANKVTFTAPGTSGMYLVAAVLRTGSSCDGGTKLDSVTYPFQVAGDHTVTVQYKCGNTTIKASATVTGRPLVWSSAIEAPEIFGYTFHHWLAGDGITLSEDGTNAKTGERADSSVISPIYIKAIYDGKLTAVYTQNNIIYFKNTLGWENVFVNFYTGNAWNNNDNGSGSPKGCGNSGVTHRNKEMTRIGDSDVWYYDYGYNGGGSSITPSLYVSFTGSSRPSVSEFWGANPGINVVYPANYADAIATDKSSENGFKAATPMFVPISQDPVAINVGSGGKANYYNAGYWTTYTPGTGYTLEIYNDAGSLLLKSIEFTSEDDLMPMKAVADLEAGKTYKYQIRRGGTGSAGIYYGNSSTMTYKDHGQSTAWSMTNTMDGGFKMCGITTNAAGGYTFNLSYSANSSSQYRLRTAVDYPIASGDYRVIYKDDVHTSYKPSAIVTNANNAKDTVSFFIRPNSSPEMKIQQATVDGETGAITWGSDITIPTATLTALPKDSVYNVCLTMDGSGAISLEKIEGYTGNFYIRTDAANSKWDNYRSDPDHLMTYSEYSITHGGYSHYYCHWVTTADTKRKNVKFCIANDYSPCISDTLTRETASGEWANINSFIDEHGNLERSANVRFMWNRADNTIKRAYLDPAKNDDNFLVLASADSKIANESAVVQSSVVFSDNENWIYEANVKAKPNAQIKLVATWGDASPIVQYFKGTESTTETLITGSTDDWYDIRLVYDYKTNRLIAAMLPSGNHTSVEPINADVMFIREHQGDISQVTFTEDGALTDIKIAYGVMRFNKWTLNNKDKDTHLPLASPASPYERAMYFISFPFEVKLSEVFGIGNYGQDWIVEYYDGAERARTGWWEGEPGFWRYVWNRKDFVLQPNVGYLLQLELASFGEESSAWNNDNERLELFFPSSGNLGTITNTTVNCTIPEHACTINRAATEGLPDTPDNPHTSYNRTIFDSHWNVMSVPTYVNANNPSFANTTWIGGDEGNVGPRFLYTWNPDDNTLTATSGTGFMYHAMHAYMVQYGGNVQWVTSGTGPASIVARDTYAEQPKEVEFRIEIQQNEKMVDQTFVIISNDDEINANFQFGEDMSKDFNARNANIYTMTADNVAAAGNSLPTSETTTIVPVGVSVKNAGDYTFAIPEGTEGIGVTLVDNETGVRTSLSALSYTVTLQPGDYTGRFVLEISPIQNTPTGLEEPTSNSSLKGRAQKVMIDGILYIVKDGKMYDARGARVE